MKIVLTKQELELFAVWKDEQIQKAAEFYADELGEIPEVNRIAYFHTHHIGGSMDAAIMGLSKWATPNETYEKMFKFPVQSSKFVFERGHFFEPFVASQFTKLTHIPTKQGITVNGESKGFPYSFAQVDFLCGDNTPLEIKVATYNSDDDAGRWGNGCTFNESGFLLEEDDEIPVEYQIQCQKQLWLTDNQTMFLAVWITSENKIRVFKIHRDEEIINAIIEAEYDFLFHHVIPKIPYTDDLHILESRDEDAVFASKDFIADCKEVQKLSEQISELQVKKDALTQKLKDSLGTHSLAVDADGNKVASCKAYAMTTFNKEELANKFPQIYQEFITKKQVTRFTISKPKTTKKEGK